MGSQPELSGEEHEWAVTPDPELLDLFRRRERGASTMVYQNAEFCERCGFVKRLTYLDVDGAERGPMVQRPATQCTLEVGQWNSAVTESRAFRIPVS